MACPQRGTSVVGVNQRSPKREPVANGSPPPSTLSQPTCHGAAGVIGDGIEKLPLLRSDEGRLREVHLGRDPLLQFVANVGSEEADGGGVAGCNAFGQAKGQRD